MSFNEISLKWNGYQVNMLNNLKSLFYDQGYADVTLVSEGESLKAHKIVLSACSPLFSSIFTQNPHKHPIIVLQDISLPALQTLLTFIYNGEVNVTQEFLPDLLKAAESLKIKGLSVVDEDSLKGISNNESSKRKLCTENDSESTRKLLKGDPVVETSKENEFPNFEQVIPKTEPPELIWAEAIITEGSEEIMSSVSDWELPNNKNCESSDNCSQISNEVDATNICTQYTHVDKNHKKKKKNKQKIRSKIVCLNADIDKRDEMIGSGKENVVSESETEKEIDDIFHGDIACEPDLETECKEVGIEGYKSPKFPCPFCTRVYHTWGYRRRHIKTRHRADKPTCKLCFSICTSQASWFEHVVRKHDIGRVEARKCLVVLMEAHAVLTCPSPPSPSMLLADINMEEIQ